MKVSGFWSLLGLGVTGLIIGNLLSKPAGTSAAFAGATQLESAAGNQLLGSPAPSTTTTKGG